MQEKIKTKYQVQNGQLLYDGEATNIHVDDDYFYMGSSPLNIYQEDGFVFVLKPLFPWFKWPMISSATGITIDERGILRSQSQNCIFDDYIKNA